MHLYFMKYFLICLPAPEDMSPENKNGCRNDPAAAYKDCSDQCASMTFLEVREVPSVIEIR